MAAHRLLRPDVDAPDQARPCSAIDDRSPGTIVGRLRHMIFGSDPYILALKLLDGRPEGQQELERLVLPVRLHGVGMIDGHGHALVARHCCGDGVKEGQSWLCHLFHPHPSSTRSACSTARMSSLRIRGRCWRGLSHRYGNVRSLASDDIGGPLDAVEVVGFGPLDCSEIQFTGTLDGI